MKSLCDQDNMIRVVYRGPVGNHLVPSPLRKVRNYGMHTNGDIFCVHFSDQEAAPKIFELVAEPKEEAPPPVQPTAEGIAEEITDAVDKATVEVISGAMADMAATESESEKPAPKKARPRKGSNDE